MSYVLLHPSVGYVGYNVTAEGGPGGYRFVASPSDAMTFPLINLAADFLEVSGPQWAKDMAKNGMLTIKEKA